MADKYGIANDWESKSSSLYFGCSCWKAILNSLIDFKKGVRIEVRSGVKTSFWKDRWCSSSPLMLEHPNLYRLARNKNAKVMDYRSPRGDSGSWNVVLRCGLNDWEVDDWA